MVFSNFILNFSEICTQVLVYLALPSWHRLTTADMLASRALLVRFGPHVFLFSRVHGMTYCSTVIVALSLRACAPPWCSEVRSRRPRRRNLSVMPTAEDVADWDDDDRAELERIRYEAAKHVEERQQSAEAALLPGAGVVLYGLTGAQELNGLTGKLQSLDATSGRWTVEIVGSGGRAVLKSIKPENLRAMQPSAHPAEQPVAAPAVQPAGKLTGSLGVGCSPDRARLTISTDELNWSPDVECSPVTLREEDDAYDCAAHAILEVQSPASRRRRLSNTWNDEDDEPAAELAAETASRTASPTASIETELLEEPGSSFTGEYI